jgi:hypothetical protein
MLRARARPILLTAAVLIAALAGLAQAEVIQRGGLRINFDGELTPRALPRSGLAPIRVSFGAKIAAVNGKTPPQLRQITIAINRHGHFNPDGLPICTVAEIQPSTTADALMACGGSLIGQGSFSAKVLLPQQAPFPSQGKVFAFNGRYRGRPAILAHVFGSHPAPTSYTLPFTIRPAKGTYGTVLAASLPQVTSQWGYVTGIQMTLGRSFRSHGRAQSYLSGSCPAPKGFPGAVFPLAHGTYAFAGHRTISATITRSCKVNK